MMDIRDSTDLTKKHGAKWAEFNKEWLGEAREALANFGGTFVKSTGDGLLAAFGLFDDEDAVRDLPGLENQNKEADERRWACLTADTFSCLEHLFQKFEEISEKHFPGELMRLGCGLDRGQIYRGIRGSKTHREFDIWGDKVNMSAKLEGFGKEIASDFEPDSSLLIVSPFAVDFLESVSGFKKVDLSGGLLNKYGLKWVLVRSYSRISNKKLKSVA
jgi:class 3 adenylate cyclase